MAATYHPIIQTAHGQATRPQAARAALLATLGRLLDRIPRLVRFGAVGATCALCQLLILGQLVRLGVELHLAITLAFLTSTQLNFALSSVITWRDRRATMPTPAALLKRLAAYNALALVSLAINQAVFALALSVTHYLLAAILGILTGMLLTYAISGRIIFRRLGRDGPSFTPASFAPDRTV